MGYIEDKEIPNRSKVYLNGSTWDTKHGSYMVLSPSSKRIGKKQESGRVYWVKYLNDDPSMCCVLEACVSSVRNGTLKNPMERVMRGIGYVGIGDYSRQSHRALYAKWKGMFSRCYPTRRTKANKCYIGCYVHEDWHSFQQFCVDVVSLANYDLFLADPGSYHLDKDVLCGGNKCYSKDTCTFLRAYDNLSAPIRYDTTAEYHARNIESNEIIVFSNLSAFARDHGMSIANLCRAIKDDHRTCKGFVVNKIK